MKGERMNIDDIIKQFKRLLPEYELRAKYNGGEDYTSYNALYWGINYLESIAKSKAADIEIGGKKYRLTDAPILKTRDKSGLCSICGFREVDG